MEVIGGALLSGLFNVLFDRLDSREVADFLRSKKAVAVLLYDLRAQLGSANKLLSDAESKQIGDSDVNIWLHDLRDAVYEADHLLDKINTESLRRRQTDDGNLLRLIPNLVSGAAFDHGVRVEASEVVRKLKVLLDQTSHLGLREQSRARVSSLKRPLSPLVEESDVCGRKADKEAILQILLSDDHHRRSSESKIAVVPIVGMGGIGKTTLARVVFDDPEVREHFEAAAWVVVSESFDVARIARTILDSVGGGGAADDPSRLQSDLKAALRGKKFLIVLDDVWCESYEIWDALRSALESGGQGSKVVVTTRSRIAAGTMGTVPEYELRTISGDDSWSLFAKHVGAASSSDERLRKIGEAIVEKCKGLPLAVKSIAGVLRSSAAEAEEWRRVLHSDIWEIPNTNVLPALWLSYQSLPPSLKRCFAYFSIFPKDYEFGEAEREKVVLLWIAEGLLQEENNIGSGRRVILEDLGKEYFNALISRSFFQRSNRNASTFLMHDLLHDLAVRVSGEISVVLDGDKPVIPAKTRHLLYWIKDSRLDRFDGLSDAAAEAAKNLRTFLALPLSSSSSSSSATNGASSSSQTATEKAVLRLLSSPSSRLRVLSLSNTPSLARLPEYSFDGAKYLRYLDLSGTNLEAVPESVCSLRNLQTLLLSRCERLTRLPANTASGGLASLQRLDLRETPLREMPPRLDGLRSLRSLSDFVVGEGGGRRLRELGELRLLRGTLRLSGLENVENCWEASLANLKEKEGLSGLVLCWRGDTDDSRKERELLSELLPSPSLEDLEINGFRGTIFPAWLGNGNSATGLIGATLARCKNCVILPSFGQLPSLRRLRIHDMESLTSIGDEFSGGDKEDDSTPFPSLESLSLDGLLAWNEWSFSRRIVFENGRFPALKHLHLEYCRRLVTGLPAGTFPSLKSLKIISCRSMETVFPSSRVPIDAVFPSLESIQIWRCPKLKTFSKKGLPSSLRKLEVHDDCEALFAGRRKWGLHRLSSLERLELSGCRSAAVESFPEEGLLPPGLARLRIDGFRGLRRLDGRGLRQAGSLRQLLICGCERLEGLPEEGLLESLSYLRIVQCPLLSHRCRRDVGEDWHKIQHIPLIIINREEI